MVSFAARGWLEDTPAILKIIPYPDHLAPILVVIVLVTLTIGAGWLLRRYWWGMLWGMAPDIIDWAILRPAIGREPIHDLFGKVETPWGFGLEMAFVALVVFVVLKGRLPLPTKT